MFWSVLALWLQFNIYIHTHTPSTLHPPTHPPTHSTHLHFQRPLVTLMEVVRLLYFPRTLCRRVGGGRHCQGYRESTAVRKSQRLLSHQKYCWESCHCRLCEGSRHNPRPPVCVCVCVCGVGGGVECVCVCVCVGGGGVECVCVCVCVWSVCVCVERVGLWSVCVCVWSVWGVGGGVECVWVCASFNQPLHRSSTW